MTTSDYVGLIGGIGGAAGALIGVFAAIAAWRSAGIARETTQLAIRQQRDALMREINLVAMRATVTATRVGQLATNAPVAMAQLYALSGRTVTIAADDPIRAKADEQWVRAQQISNDAIAVLSSLEAKSDAELAAELRRADGRLVQLEAMKEVLSAELEGINSDSRERRAENAALRAAAMTHRP